ncbi:gluconate 5-dehydrogenase/3-oxoacyl-[acyl-carrier protein] reductase [Archangium gephyra]|uniref:3-oxoacyl-[acyl-carrier protein] reductase n=1 Tax=Archangium gephyra TaxID=48 RepID=A0AAC8QCV4_9BACT|nr:SDR family oxidoreductase [Archangium gephyra]AKJ05380.1 3-oxoacyl-[acyl-carrier protein] reductase [Archangium gephyra]REG36065.1 gluconate 5-dehydrogenase/3-oxoacyl-[acyl-carrier protein] reductase [Archangium gephyra]
MSLKLFSLEGKVAVVTGGSKGLGLEMARSLAAAGADVTITSRHAEEVEAAAAEIRQETGRRILAMEADVAIAADVDGMVERTIRELGQLDILVNNAGINLHGFVHEQSEEEWNKVLQTDLTGPMLCTRAATRHMIPRRSGRIINISSIFGLVGYPKRGPYCAAKGALVSRGGRGIPGRRRRGVEPVLRGHLRAPAGLSPADGARARCGAAACYGFQQLAG